MRGRVGHGVEGRDQRQIDGREGKEEDVGMRTDASEETYRREGDEGGDGGEGQEGRDEHVDDDVHVVQGQEQHFLEGQ